MIHDHVIPAGLSLLPPKMNTPEAVVMLLAIGLQESRFLHRKQISGPARGYWQFELGGVRGVTTHHASKGHLEAACDALNYHPTEVYGAIADNDILACVVARLLLWTHPDPLPTDSETAWRYYLGLWRPGRPHPETWDGFFAKASRTAERSQS